MNSVKSQMIKYLLTEFRSSQTGNYFVLGRWCTKLAALGLYGMTSGQIFSRPALPLSQ